LNELDEMVKGDGMQTLQVEDEDEPVIIDRESSSEGERVHRLRSSSLGFGILG